MRRDLINAAILWFVLTFLAELCLPALYPRFPLAAAQEAALSDKSFQLLLQLGTPVFTFVIAMLAYSLINFRARGDEPESGAPLRASNWLAGIWLAVTGGLCVVVIIHPGLTGLAEFQGDKNPDVVIQVIGKQWAWDIAYPAYNIKGETEVVLPVNKRIKFDITSADVLHSFWIPAFRDKMDAVPGQTTTMYITPNKIESYNPNNENFNLRVQCTELCGTGHAGMSVPVRILSQADFEAWAKEKGIGSADPVVRGQQLAKSQGCAACHSIDGTKIVGPTWKGLFNSSVDFEDGTTLKADEAYIRQFINNPDFKVIKGYQKGIMPPTFGKTLTPAQIDDLIAYIKSLEK
jgi:cytochrome c oxidase subunit II